MTEIDVSGCKYADCSIDNCFCYENKNCYYKQLKRLETENTKLKEKMARIERILENNLDLFDVYRWDLGTYLLEIIRGAER